jgi:ABC-type nitrate/sulfonate/bicarbonate transport system substrate-binding protein
MRRWTTVLFILLLLLLPSGCRQGSAPHPERLTVGVARGPYALLIFLARERGHFAEQGLEVEIREYDSGFLALDDLGLQLDMVVTPEYPFVLQAGRHPELRILGTVATSDIHELVARRDLGISSARDLRGKIIGVTPGTAAEFFLYSFLGLEPDISWRDVRIQHFAQEVLLEKLRQGTIDATVLGGTDVRLLKAQLGSQAVSWPAQWGLKSYWCLVTDQEQLAARGAAVKALLAALVAAEEELMRRPEVLRGLTDWNSLGVDLSEEQRLSFRLALEQGLLLAMEEQAEWLGITPFPNYLEWIALDPLLALSPQRVTLFR